MATRKQERRAKHELSQCPGISERRAVSEQRTPRVWGQLSLRALEVDEKADLRPAGSLARPGEMRAIVQAFYNSTSKQRGKEKKK